ncbi:skin secretory protein xP2-like [Homarus americanus]|uniref:skin secretory protein xP2-like n=1 Tax=Homarus americanus TaxID=6706 RepID=UPI001C47E41F|nr:skin secretory protein xP2-like [Homarus americanus]
MGIWDHATTHGRRVLGAVPTPERAHGAPATLPELLRPWVNPWDPSLPSRKMSGAVPPVRNPLAPHESSDWSLSVTPWEGARVAPWKGPGEHDAEKGPWEGRWGRFYHWVLSGGTIIPGKVPGGSTAPWGPGAPEWVPETATTHGRVPGAAPAPERAPCDAGAPWRLLGSPPSLGGFLGTSSLLGLWGPLAESWGRRRHCEGPWDVTALGRIPGDVAAPGKGREAVSTNGRSPGSPTSLERVPGKVPGEAPITGSVCGGVIIPGKVPRGSTAPWGPRAPEWVFGTATTHGRVPGGCSYPREGSLGHQRLSPELLPSLGESMGPSLPLVRCLGAVPPL